MGREDEVAERIALINRTGNRLIELGRSDFPVVIARSAPPYRAALYALVARATGTMEAILCLAKIRREADLAVLVRALYDHTTILAWIAVDPDANYALWRAEDARQRVNAHKDWERRWGRELLNPTRLAEFERIGIATSTVSGRGKPFVPAETFNARNR